MKKTGFTAAFCALLLSMSGLAQENYKPFLVKESIRKSSAELKTGIVGSYPRHTEEFTWDEAWLPYRTIEASYKSFGEPDIIEYNQNGVRTRNMYYYNGQHLQTEVVSQSMSGGVWVNVSRRVSSFNNLGYELETRNEDWTGTAWSITGGTQVTYEMTGERVMVMIAKEWDLATSGWINSMRETYTYPATGAHFTSIIMENWEDAWINVYKSEYTWSGDDISQSISYSYDNDEWVLSGKTTFEYPGNDSFIMTSYSPMGAGTWLPTSRITWLYDGHDNATLEQMEMYMNDWIILSATRYQLTYSGNNLTERITQNYSMFPPASQNENTGIQWDNLLKEVFSNFASLGTDPTALSAASLSIFPNPAGKEAIVRISSAQSGSVTLTLTSMTGQKVLEQVIITHGSDFNYSLNLNEVRPGSYLLVARNQQGREIGKTRLIRE